VVGHTVEATRQIGGDDLDVLRGWLHEVDDRNLSIISGGPSPEQHATYIWNQVPRCANVQVYCDLGALSVTSHTVRRDISYT
jgi:hypothetical protein